ncbi:MAG: ergothioneine biosynthesis protein EgtB [Hyphomicrobium sp.]
MSPVVVNLKRQDIETSVPRANLAERLSATRKLSLDLAAPLSAEDMIAQAMDDASPTKWHLAHVTWFFETFVLKPHLAGFRAFDEAFNYLFNSYYEALGPRQPRPKRSLLTRPTIERVFQYRAHVDEALGRMLSDAVGEDAARLIEIGINHEQQHQELMLTDILALFAANPINPAYRDDGGEPAAAESAPVKWIGYAGGIVTIGSNGDTFIWDNEGPRHDVLLRPFRLASRLVNNAEWMQFIADGGYRTPSLWLADGWAHVQHEGWSAPLYWRKSAGRWLAMGLTGLQPIAPSEPVCHVSYFEADAFARWTGKRLPTEFEWEVAAKSCGRRADTARTGTLRPTPAIPALHSTPQEMFGETWQWMSSAYQPYPGYRPPAGAIGEYNGKFMVSQQVLRGSSFATPAGHSRATYRNFFYPQQRWQFCGLRLASDECP